MGDKEFWDKVEHMEPVADDSAWPVEDVANPASPHSPESPESPVSPDSPESPESADTPEEVGAEPRL